MPTHAMFHRAASAAVEQKPSPVPSHCKYITVQTENGDICPILFDKHLQHKSMLPPAVTVLSAGFVMVLGATILVLPIHSESLNIGPRPEDQQLISQFLNH